MESTRGSYPLASSYLPGQERPRAAPPVDVVVVGPGPDGCSAWMLVGGFSSSTHPSAPHANERRCPAPDLPHLSPYQDQGFCMARNQTPSWPGATLGGRGSLSFSSPTAKSSRFFFPKLPHDLAVTGGLSPLGPHFGGMDGGDGCPTL